MSPKQKHPNTVSDEVRDKTVTHFNELPCDKKHTHQGSNSWMMLSKRMTAKSLELKPASQARKRMVNDSKDCQPAGCDRPPDRPPAAPVLLPLSVTAVLLRPFPEYEDPEFSDDLCLFSETG